MTNTELIKLHQEGMDVDSIINARAKLVAQHVQIDQHKAPKPIEQNDEITTEEAYQLAFWRSQINPLPTENRFSRGFYARFDKEARARAIGLLPQTQDPFDGPLPTKAEGLDALVEKYGKNQEKQATVVETTVYEA